MPRIRFFLIICPHCRTNHKVRIEIVEERQSVECLTCGEFIQLNQYKEILKSIYDYSKVIIDLESYGKVDLDVFIPQKPVQYMSSILDTPRNTEKKMDIG